MRAGLLLCLLTHVVACAEHTVALEGLDPIELINGHQTKGQPALSAERGTFRYLFSSQANRSKFLSDPDRYGLQLNGQCVMSDGMPGSQKMYAVVEGRIYLGATEMCIEKFKEDPSSFVNVQTGQRLAARPKPGADQRTKVAILLFEGVQIIDYTGPYEVFGDSGFNVYTVAQSAGALTTVFGMQVVPHFTFASAPQPDVLVTPGGNVKPDNAEVIRWIQDVSKKAKYVMSVCNGAFWLAQAGLLENQSATTVAGAIDVLQEKYPKTRVMSDQRYADNGKVITTAGLSSGIDGALHLVSKMRGLGFAQAVALGMEYNWDPSGRYARAALADKPIRWLAAPLPKEKARSVTLSKQEGDTRWWRKTWEVDGGGSASEVLKSVEQTLSKRWQRAGSGPDSEWVMDDGHGGRWMALAQVMPTQSAEKVLVSIRVERSSPSSAL
jgi:putative intracellular protease/amidase/YHS domain-containing protein